MTIDQAITYLMERGLSYRDASAAFAGPECVDFGSGFWNETLIGHPKPSEQEIPSDTSIVVRMRRLNNVRQQATALIQANLPQPWEILKDQATPAFIEWADAYLVLVAAELARLEDAINNDEEAIPDWPEVEE
jgi:hypothetical protein